MEPDGKNFVKERAKEKHSGTSKVTSIITNICNSVNENIIKEFFSNPGLRDAWIRVLPDLKREFK
jgi:hypothetical protein